MIGFFEQQSHHIQGVPKKMRLGVCLISQQRSIGFLNHFFLLKTEIHMQILNTKPFLCDIRGAFFVWTAPLSLLLRLTHFLLLIWYGVHNHLCHWNVFPCPLDMEGMSLLVILRQTLSSENYWGKI